MTFPDLQAVFERLKTLRKQIDWDCFSKEGTFHQDVRMQMDDDGRFAIYWGPSEYDPDYSHRGYCSTDWTIKDDDTDEDMLETARALLDEVEIDYHERKEPFRLPDEIEKPT